MTPEGWTLTRLLDAVELPSGQADPRQKPYRDMPLIAPNHIESGTGRLVQIQTAAQQAAKSGKYHFLPGDVLYSKIRPYLKKATLARFEGLCSADMYPLRSTARIAPGFLLNVLLGESFTEFATSVSMRTGIPKINRTELAQYELPLPPLPEQRKIAAILSSIDDAIEKSQAVIDQVRLVKKGLMQELLTRGLPGRHKKFKNTEIGEIPEEWEVVEFGSLIAEGPTNGLYRPQKDYGQGVPIVRIDDFQNGDVLPEEGFRRVAIDAAMTSRFRLAEGDIVINRVNSLSHLGKCAIVVRLASPTVFESNMMRLTLDSSRMSASFGFLWLCREETKDYFRGRAKKAVAQASINQGDVRGLPTAVPSCDEQNSVVQVLDSHSRRLVTEQRSLGALHEMKESLMSVLLTGQVRVAPAPEAT